MPIFVSKCYEIITEESAENGEVEDSGFVFENCAFTFRELVEEMKNYSYSSSAPCRYNSWLISGSETDYQTGEEESYSLHPCLANGAAIDSRTARYWEKALRAAGFLK